MLGRANIEVSSKVKIANYRYDRKKMFMELKSNAL